ncbi:MAG: alpha/beta fold hydrolase, partial [Rhodoferax sp.]
MNAPLSIQVPALPEGEHARLETVFPERLIPVGDGAAISVRECGAGPAVVCLHGIGSGAASWLETAALLVPEARVIAWDAPGYGASTPLTMAAPRATDYAQCLCRMLDALQIDRCVLVGHSLGALVAAAAAHAGHPLARRIDRLVLISPARGYGAAERLAQSGKVRAERIGALADLGVAGMAARRSGRLLSDGASELARQWVRWNMGRLHEGGYRQAIELLCGDDLLAYLPPAMPVRVACGALDVVTTPAACAEVARACGVTLELIADAGHACYVEQPVAVASLLRDEI